MTTDDRRRRATLGDVASAASVSVATASRSMRDDMQISIQTRRRVQAVAEQLGYVANATARNLKLRRSTTLGLMTPDVTDPIHGQIATGFQQRAAELGYSVILANGFNQDTVELQALADFVAHQVAGVVLMGSVLRPTAAARFLRPSAAVFIESEYLSRSGSCGDLKRGCIRTDDCDGIRQLVEHLTDCGHRSIAYFGEHHRASGHLRLRALSDQLTERGLPELSAHEPTEDGEAMADVARRIAADAPDAVVCYDDKLALNLIDALRTAGVRVPADIAVTGFDDIPFARISNPRLTTVTQESEHLGMLGVEMLVTTLDTGHVPQSRMLPVRLVVRESTANHSRLPG
jgi:LacI family transcriptional regulator